MRLSFNCPITIPTFLLGFPQRKAQGNLGHAWLRQPASDVSECSPHCSPEASRNFESCFRLLPPLAPQVGTINTLWYGNRTCGRLLIVTTPPSGASHPHTLRRSRRRETSPSFSVAWWPIHDFFFHPETHRTDWWTIVIFLATVASFAGAAILWVQHSG
jgi:hypothetical protein